MAKCFANEMVRDVAGSALQLMGGYGYSKEYPMEQRLRDAWGWGIAGGAVDILARLIAERLADVVAMREQGEPTIPTTIALERATNPFLRSVDADELAQRRAAKDAFKG